MTIPEIRKRLLEMAEEHHLDELADLANELSRRNFGRAPRTSVKITDELRDKIRSLHAAEPDLSQQAIADALNINPGRVSEVLHGWRE